MSTLPSLECFILEQGLDDWVAIGTAMNKARSLGAADERSQLGLALDAAVGLARAGLVRFGSVHEDGWRYFEDAPEEVAARVIDTHETKGRAYSDFYLWLENTAEGDNIALCSSDNDTEQR